MASIKEQFEIPGTLKTWSYALIGIGGAALLFGMFTKGFSSDEHEPYTHHPISHIEYTTKNFEYTTTQDSDSNQNIK